MKQPWNIWSLVATAKDRFPRAEPPKFSVSEL